MKNEESIQLHSSFLIFILMIFRAVPSRRATAALVPMSAEPSLLRLCRVQPRVSKGTPLHAMEFRRMALFTLHLKHVRLSASFSHFAPGLCGSEHIEAVDEVCHEIGVNGIGFRVGSAGGTDHAADVAALVEDVVGLEADGGDFVFEESVGHLCIPDEFVGVHVRRSIPFGC